MYTFDSRIRYSETDETGALSLLGVINYMQDCSTFQSEDIGLGVEYLEKKKRAWLLSSWRIVIDRYPEEGLLLHLLLSHLSTRQILWCARSLIPVSFLILSYVYTPFMLLRT